MAMSIFNCFKQRGAVRYSIYLISAFYLLLPVQVMALTEGSDTAVSREGLAFFSGVDNEMIGFGAFLISKTTFFILLLLIPSPSAYLPQEKIKKPAFSRQPVTAYVLSLAFSREDHVSTGKKSSFFGKSTIKHFLPSTMRT